MHEKNIKRIVVKQLKRQFPNWGRLAKKKKKALAKQTLEEVVKTYLSDSEIAAPLNELTGAPAIREAEIMTLADMERFITNHNRQVVELPSPSRNKYLKDPELRAIDKLLNNSIIDRPPGPGGIYPRQAAPVPFPYAAGGAAKIP